MTRTPPLTGLDHPGHVAYLAGLLDANGRIEVRRQSPRPDLHHPSYSPAASVTTAATEVLAHLTATHGGSIIEPRSDRALPVWRVYGTNAEALVAAVAPLLHAHTAQAAHVLDLADLDTIVGAGVQTPTEAAYRTAVYERVAALNSRGRLTYPEGPLPPRPTERRRGARALPVPTSAPATRGGRPHAFTPGQAAELAAARARGMTLAALSRMTGVSASAVKNALDRHAATTEPSLLAGVGA